MKFFPLNYSLNDQVDKLPSFWAKMVSIGSILLSSTRFPLPNFCEFYWFLERERTFTLHIHTFCMDIQCSYCCPLNLHLFNRSEIFFWDFTSLFGSFFKILFYKSMWDPHRDFCGRSRKVFHRIILSPYT